MSNSAAMLTTYGLASLGAVATYIALPRDGRSRRAPAVLIGLAAAIGMAVLAASRFGGDAAHNLALGFLALLSLGGAVRVITHPQPVYSALYFVLVALSSSGMVILVGAEFVGAALVIVYAGAILVTYVFVIMLAQQSSDTQTESRGGPLDYDGQAREPAMAVIVGFTLAALIGGQIVARDSDKSRGHTTPVAQAIDNPAARPGSEETGNTLAVGGELLTRYAIPVELSGILLLVAMVGAIALARKPVPVEAGATHEQPPAGEIGKHVKPF